MFKWNLASYAFEMVFVTAVFAAGSSLVAAADQPVVSFRLGQWKKSHFDDGTQAKRHYDTLRKLGCEAKQDSHSGHYDVAYRAPNWRSVKFKTDRVADQWAHWLEANGFETVFIQPAQTGHLETVAFRMIGSKSAHFDTAAQAAAQTDTLRMLGCEVKQGSHSGHYDVSYHCPKWRTIGVENHDAAHRWEKWLKANGFETSHEHHTARSENGKRRKR